jgi:hypothetical protein
MSPPQSDAAATVPPVRSEADQHRLVAICGTDQFNDIEFAIQAHRRSRGIADMRIMRPNCRTGIAAL